MPPVKFNLRLRFSKNLFKNFQKAKPNESISRGGKKGNRFRSFFSFTKASKSTILVYIPTAVCFIEQLQKSLTIVNNH